MRFLAPAAVALILAWSPAAGAQARDETFDPHAQNPSPDSSSGVDPGTTVAERNRITNRGMIYAAPTEQRLVARGRIEPSPAVGTTTTTAAEIGAERTSRPNRTLLVTGGAIFLGTYAASAVVGGILSEDADRNLVIPVAGPWIALGNRDCGLGECGFYEDVNAWALIASGVLQGAGIALAISSLFIAEPRERTQAKVRVVPIGAGVGAIGTF